MINLCILQALFKTCWDLSINYLEVNEGNTQQEQEWHRFVWTFSLIHLHLEWKLLAIMQKPNLSRQVLGSFQKKQHPYFWRGECYAFIANESKWYSLRSKPMILLVLYKILLSKHTRTWGIWTLKIFPWQKLLVARCLDFVKENQRIRR